MTGVAAAFWAHSPVVVITPETGSLTQVGSGWWSGSRDPSAHTSLVQGLGGFQEMSQLAAFSEITKYQAHVCSPKRMAEFTNRCSPVNVARLIHI